MTQIFKYIIFVGLFLIVITASTITFFFLQLPDDSSLQNYKPNVMTRIHASNGNLVKEFSREYRIFIPVKDIPSNLINAFISAEDKNFYTHFGVDPLGIFRAFIKNSINIFSDKRPEGASTITQQVAKNFLLSDELSINRKIKEASLAYKLERHMSKDEILEQYLNNVYLGSGAYGIADAAWVYFSKTPDLLTIDEIALIAGLAPAPSFYSPLVNPDLAIKTPIPPSIVTDYAVQRARWKETEKAISSWGKSKVAAPAVKLLTSNFLKYSGLTLLKMDIPKATGIPDFSWGSNLTKAELKGKGKLGERMGIGFSFDNKFYTSGF